MRPQLSGTTKKFATFVLVRTAAHTHRVEFGAVSSVLTGILVIRFTGRMGPTAASHTGGATHLPDGVIADDENSRILGFNVVADESELEIIILTARANDTASAGPKTRSTCREFSR